MKQYTHKMDIDMKKTLLCCIVDFIDQRISNSLSGKHDTLTNNMQHFKLQGNVCIAKQADNAVL